MCFMLNPWSPPPTGSVAEVISDSDRQITNMLHSGRRSHHDTVVTRGAQIPIVTKTKMYWDAKAMPLLMRHRKTFCLYTCDTTTASILRSSPKLETVLVTLRSPLNVWRVTTYYLTSLRVLIIHIRPKESSIITGSQINLYKYHHKILTSIKIKRKS